MPKPVSSLPPNVEARIAVWEDIQYRLSHNQQPKVRPAITLSRQFGCEAFPLAERLQGLLREDSGEPWNIYDQTLVGKVARDEGISVRLLSSLGDRNKIVEGLGIHSGEVSDEVAFEKVAKALVAIAETGNAIVIGRGGAVLCRELKNCFHFRLEAGFEHRVRSIMRRLELPEAEARETVSHLSKQREEFFRNVLHEDPADLKNYDAVFNTERRGLDAIAAAIVAYLKRSWPESGYFKGSGT